MERDKSSRRGRDSTKERDHKHQSSKDKYKEPDSDEDNRRHHNRHHSKHRSDDDNEQRHRSENRHRRHLEEDSFDRERSIERPRSEREGSRDRREKSHDRYKRERSQDRENRRDDSVERLHSSKRKERGDSEDRNDGAEKRVRVSEGKHVNGKENEDRQERRSFEDGNVKDKELTHEKREKKRFVDKVKEANAGADEERESLQRTVKKEELIKDGQHVDPVANGAAMESLNKVSQTLPSTSSLVPIDSPATKVSSISTNENKGVNIIRSHAVPGKSSTDGTTSDAGKRAGFSLDALAKAKRALQMQKELAEKLKKIPSLNMGAGQTRGPSPHLGTIESHKASSSTSGRVGSSNSGILPTPQTTAPSSSNLQEEASINLPPSGLPHLTGLTAQKYEAVKRAQELAAKMGFRQDPEFAPLINMFPGQLPPEVAVQPKPSKVPVLRLDALGREVDEQGNVVNMPKPSSTLKVNINKKKKDAFQILKPELEVDPDQNPHFDPSMGLNKTKILRPKRSSFLFVEEGKWSKDAETIKLKSQFGEARAKELKAKQAQLAKAKAEPDINPNLIEVSQRVMTHEKQKEPIPEVEWWDVPILQSGTYGDITGGSISHEMLKMEKITIYIEHPRPIEPPAEPAPPPPQPLKLTKKEQKKLRTQRRLAREKDKQEMIRQGLLEPPKSKVKMSNLMKVLGSEATQDPTKLEMEIRSAAAEREQAHIDRNIARKLTPDERREKKERKLFDDPNRLLETTVSVYKINNLSHPQTRFKVDVNAQENRLTGCLVISDGITVVVVEGGKKSIKRYGKLMLRRIDWAAAVKTEEDGDDEDEEKAVNKCVLVWQGSVAKPNFHRFLVHEVRTEAAARKFFADAGVPHYWDLAVNFKDDDI